VTTRKSLAKLARHRRIVPKITTVFVLLTMEAGLVAYLQYELISGSKPFSVSWTLVTVLHSRAIHACESIFNI